MIFPFNTDNVINFVNGRRGRCVETGITPNLLYNLFRPHDNQNRDHKYVCTFTRARIRVNVLNKRHRTDITLPNTSRFRKSAQLQASTAVVRNRGVTFGVTFPHTPRITRRLGVFNRVIMAAKRVIVTEPSARLLVLKLLPTDRRISTGAPTESKISNYNRANSSYQEWHWNNDDNMGLGTQNRNHRPHRRNRQLGIIVPRLDFTTGTARFSRQRNRVRVMILHFLRGNFVRFGNQRMLQHINQGRPTIITGECRCTGFRRRPLFISWDRDRAKHYVLRVLFDHMVTYLRDKYRFLGDRYCWYIGVILSGVSNGG